CRVSGASGARRPWRSRLHLYAPVAGRDHRDAPLAGGTFGAAGSARAPAARPLSALWRLSGVPQPPAWSDHPHATPARQRRGGDGPRVPALALGATAQARVCARYGALPLVAAGGTADDRGHHARGGHPEDPPASATFCRPTSHGPGPCPPG